MRSYKSGITCLLAALLVFFIAGCGQETVTVPGVVSVTPAQGATGVIINTTVTATFNMAMNPASITAPGTFTVTGPGGTAVAGSVTYSGLTATFTPSAFLAYGTTYTATITTGAATPGGAELISNYVWTFTSFTVPPALTPAPTVTSTNPVTLPENVNVPLNQVVSATFSEPMNALSITGTTNFTLMDQTTSTLVGGQVEYAPSGNALVFQPSVSLANGDTFLATITTGVESQADVAMASPYSWTFKTVAGSFVQPELVKTIPANLATGVPLNQAISATFTEAMNPLTLNTATFLLYQGSSLTGTPIQATITYDPVNFIATLKPTALLTANTAYIVTVTTGATDMEGNPLLGNSIANPWTFNTGTGVIAPPVVLGPTILPFGGFGGGAGMTNQGIHTVINGNIGTTGASTTMTGFHDTSLPIVGAVWPCTYTETTLNIGQVNGAIDTAPPPPTVECPDEGTATTMAIATEAALEARTAYNTLQGLPSTGVLAGELGGKTIYPGVYTNSSTVGITNGDLTLDAQGNPNAYWVFQIGSSLTVGLAGQPRNVILANGAKASNVFWAVGSGATINGAGGGTFEGTVISQAGISVSTAGVATITTINGRLIALTASTTLVNTVINTPAP
jgi:hypothetical protein